MRKPTVRDIGVAAGTAAVLLGMQLTTVFVVTEQVSHVMPACPTGYELADVRIPGNHNEDGRTYPNQEVDDGRWVPAKACVRPPTTDEWHEMWGR